MNYEKYAAMRRILLRCLDNRNNWGASHTSFKRMLKKIPVHDRGSKEVKKATSDLIKEGKVILKKTVEEHHVSLNPRLMREIKAEEAGE